VTLTAFAWLRNFRQARPFLCMSTLIRHARNFAIGIILALAPSSSQAWELPVEMGLVTCSFAALSPPPAKSDPEDMIGGRRDVECSFGAGMEAPHETYVGTLQFVGEASDVLGKGAIMFVAKAPMSMASKVGVIQQRYAISKVAATGSQRPLAGQSDTSIILHPLEHKFDRPTLAIGRIPGLIVIMELKLKAAPT